MKPQKIKCPECGGTGEIQDGEEILECPVCEGKGSFEDDSDFTGEI